MANERENPPADVEEDVLAWIESFATVWESQQGKRMDGRVLGLLLISSEPYLAATDIARILNASAGAVSMATRALVSVGFITRHTVPGDRRHYFRAEDDVWGTFLLGEREYLRRLIGVFGNGLALDAGAAPGPRTRLRNADRYMRWLQEYHRKMAEDWREYRDQLQKEEEG
ncbi:GbsR/MarR family transcriptional regulator [Microbacterium sp. gxy059]|uniref:GbsR/MarR family transcriptional regulator n=1 Tax=Microbacterium sp. gxy059 TaxID=2957199 RepID=UPI003D96A06E